MRVSAGLPVIAVVAPSPASGFVNGILEGVHESLALHSQSGLEAYRLVCSFTDVRETTPVTNTNGLSMASELEGAAVERLIGNVRGLIVLPLRLLDMWTADLAELAKHRIPVIFLGCGFGDRDQRAFLSKTLLYPEEVIAKRITGYVEQLMGGAKLKPTASIFVVGEQCNAVLNQRAANIARELTMRLPAANISLRLSEPECTREEAGRSVLRKILPLLREQKKGDRSLLVFTTDYAAIGALADLRLEPEISVPDDVLLMGIDDEEFSRYVEPGLTSLQMFPKRVGSAAVDALLRMIDGRSAEPPPLSDAVGQIQIRKSTTPF